MLPTVLADTVLRHWCRTSDATIVRSAGGGPVRPIHPGRCNTHVGRFQSAKCGRSMHWESPVEEGVIRFCEADPGIVSYLAQPHRLEMKVSDRGRPLVYMPDLERLWADGTREVVEAKSPKDKRWISDPGYAAKLDRAAAVYRRLGWRFTIVEEKDLASHPATAVVRRIVRSRFVDVPQSSLLDFLGVLERSRRGVPRSRLLPLLGEGVAAGRRLDALVIRRLASFDLTGADRAVDPLVRPVLHEEPAIAIGRPYEDA